MVGLSPSPNRRPLRSRPMDLFYFVFFLPHWRPLAATGEMYFLVYAHLHIPSTLLVDCQGIWPKYLVPEFLQGIPPWYVSTSGDPLIGGAMGIFSNGSELGWFKSFMYLEALFQLPVFFLGVRGLWKDSPGIYGLLVLYGASTATTTLACLVAIIDTPLTSAATISQKVVSISSQQRILLLSSYVPFFIIPLCIAIDMALRLQNLASVGIRALESSKSK